MRVHHILPTIALLALTACGGSKEDNQVTETRMDDIDSLEGTISDDAINMDEATDEGPVDAPPPPMPGEAPKAKLDKSQSEEIGGQDKADIKTDDAPSE